VDVSERAGLYGGATRYGLGVVASDLNGDGCPDLYIANDFQEDDFLYYNNCDGTFTESIATAVGHTSHASMGVDAADVNNDGRPDLMVLDMLPDQEKILKTSANAETFDVYVQKLEAGFHPQYARNTLQLNRGHRRFSEIGYLPAYTQPTGAGPLVRRPRQRRLQRLVHYERHLSPAERSGLPGVCERRRRPGDPAQRVRRVASSAHREMPQIPIASYAFRNNGDLTFTNQAQAWGLGQPGSRTARPTRT